MAVRRPIAAVDEDTGSLLFRCSTFFLLAVVVVFMVGCLLRMTSGSSRCPLRPWSVFDGWLLAMVRENSRGRLVRDRFLTCLGRHFKNSYSGGTLLQRSALHVSWIVVPSVFMLFSRAAPWFVQSFTATVTLSIRPSPSPRAAVILRHFFILSSV